MSRFDFCTKDRVELGGVKGTVISASDLLWIEWEGGHSNNGFSVNNPLLAQIRKLPPEGPLYVTGQWYKPTFGEGGLLYKLADNGWHILYHDKYSSNAGSVPELYHRQEPFAHHLPLVEVELP